MDHVRTGGTLLNLKFTPQVLQGEEGIEKLSQLIRTYFRLGGHHIQQGMELAGSDVKDKLRHPITLMRIAYGLE